MKSIFINDNLNFVFKLPTLNDKNKFFFIDILINLRFLLKLSNVVRDCQKKTTSFTFICRSKNVNNKIIHFVNTLHKKYYLTPEGSMFNSSLHSSSSQFFKIF